jgi:hypothetical protein
LLVVFSRPGDADDAHPRHQHDCDSQRAGDRLVGALGKFSVFDRPIPDTKDHTLDRSGSKEAISLTFISAKKSSKTQQG